MAWLAICDRCGWKYKNTQLRLEWTGLRTCCGPGTNQCWEARHPQDFVKGVVDRQNPPWVRPEGTDTFQITYYFREDGTPIKRESGYSLVRE